MAQEPTSAGGQSQDEDGRTANTAAEGRDPSTLASLRPEWAREAHFRTYKNSPRLHGSHFLALRRPTRIPESAREYQPGDPLNLIDWKAYARTDQLIIREIRDEASATVRIGFDVSETMQWPDALVPVVQMPPRKAEIASRVALHLAYLHLRAGDQVELRAAVAEKERDVVLRAAPRGPLDVVALFERCSRGQFSAEAIQGEFLSVPGEPRGVDVCYWIGDALGAADFRGFMATGKRQLFLHSLSSLEAGIAWIEGDTTYFDEGSGRREYQGQALRHQNNYDKKLERWRQRLKDEAELGGGAYRLITDLTPIPAYLVDLSSFWRSQLGAGKA